MSTRPTHNVVRVPTLLLMTAETIIFYSAVYIASLVLRDPDGGPIGDYVGGNVSQAIIVSLVMLLSFLSMGLYQFNQRIYYREIIARVVVAMLVGSAALAIMFFILPDLDFSRRVWATSMALAILPILLVRYIFLLKADTNIFRRNVLILGTGNRAASIADMRRRADRRGFRIVGSIPMSCDMGNTNDALVIRKDKTLLEIAEEMNADDIVIAMDDRRGKLPVQELLNCKLHGIDVLDLLEFLERESGKIRVDLLNPSWLTLSSGFKINKTREATKRIIDFIVSAIALLFVWPIFILVAAAIKIEDGLGSPVLYRQKRVGIKGEEFDVLKFRSMRENAEADGEAVWAKKDDDRVTRVGRFIRKTRIDELPQLFNVLRGQMAIVGPRPERPEFVTTLSETVPYYSERHTVKPGVTGWAQLNYSYGSSAEDALEKLNYDLYYVKNHNLILDIAIMIQTVEVVLWGKGAR